MRNRKDLKLDTGKRIKSITLLPCSLLTFMGWLDARRGTDSIPNARVDRYLSKCAARERLEVLLTESRYEGHRKAGAAAIVKLKTYNGAYDSIPSDTPDGSPYSIRANARNAAKRNSLTADRETAKTQLIEINESLIHADTVLFERIRKTREKALTTKIAAYVKGVRKKIPTYAPNLEMSDDAYAVYKEKHSPGDTAISEAAQKIKEE